MFLSCVSRGSVPNQILLLAQTQYIWLLPKFRAGYATVNKARRTSLNFKKGEVLTLNGDVGHA